MKKWSLVMCACVVAVAVAAQASAQLTVRAGVDMGGEHEASGPGGSFTDDTEAGIFLAVEYPAVRDMQFEAGAGLEFQLPRGADDPTVDGQFQVLPIYGYGMYFLAPGQIRPYVVVRLGLNILFEGDDDYTGSGLLDLSGGLMFAFGGGATIGTNQRAEMTYEVSQGEASAFGSSADITYSRLRLGYGIGF